MMRFLFLIILTLSKIVMADHTFDYSWDKDGNWKKDVVEYQKLKQGIELEHIDNLKTIYLTKTIDDLIKYGYKKEDIAHMKNMADCNSNKLTIIKGNKKDYKYELKYPVCWVFKQPFQNINQDDNVWFMINFSDHSHIQLFRVYPLGIEAIYPRLKLKKGKPTTWFGARDVFFINKCKHKWMNHSIAIEIGSSYSRWDAWEIQNLNAMVHYGYRYNDGTEVDIRYRVEIPNSDLPGTKNTSFPWFSNNPQSDGYCEEIYRVVRKRVYYEK